MRTCPSCRRRYEGHHCPTCLFWAPSPGQIRAACRRIQRTWSPTEEQARSNYKVVPAMTKLAEMVICTKD